MAEGQLQIFAPDANEASIRACALKAIEQGGGKVVLPMGTIQISQPLPVGAGLTYEGSKTPSWLELSNNLSVGTVLVGDGAGGVLPGTFNCFEWNPNDRASLAYANPTAMHADGIRGFEIKNLVLRAFNYGVKFGARYATGVHSLKMDQVIAEYCNWGYWTENCMQPTIGYVMYAQCRLGGFFHADSMDALWHYGNGVIQHIYGQNSSAPSDEKSKGIVITARGSNSELNNLTVLNLQANGFNSPTYTQSSSPVITAGSPDILITGNIGKFAVDSFVSFGSSVGNVDSNVLYCIQSIVDNGDGTGSIRIGTRKRATTVFTPSATGSSSITLRHPLIEIGGEGNNSLTFCRFPLIDCEAASGLGVSLQQMIGTYIEASIISNGSADGVTLAATAMSPLNTVAFRRPVTNAYINITGLQLEGFLPTSHFGLASAFHRYQGLLGDGTVHRIFLSSSRRSVGNRQVDQGHIYGNDPSGYDSVGLGAALAQQHTVLASGATIAFTDGGHITYGGASGGTLTLPAITANMRGLEIHIVNPTAGGLSINSSGGQTINGAATFTAPANSLSTFRASSADGTTFFWAAK